MSAAKRKTNLNLNFKHSIPKTYSIADMKEHFGTGWHLLLDKAFRMVRFIEGAEIRSAKRNFGLLHVYVEAPDQETQEAAEGVAWKVERLSAKVCEGCGNHGVRRKNLRYPFNFCTVCFTKYLDDQDDPLSLFLPGKGGLFNDDTTGA